MPNYTYIKIPISFLETIDVSKETFMQDTDKILKEILSFLPYYKEIKNIFLIKDSFVVVINYKNNINFKSSQDFKSFSNFIKNTKYKSHINIDDKKREISISKDISPNFYYLLNEFLI